VPLLRPVIFFVLTLGFIGTFQVFDQIYVMTSGGPAKSTITLGYLIYQQGFSNYAMGYAAAIAIVLFAMIMTIFLIQRRIVGSND
jgi:multiple sugar transport system permease protein